MEFPELSTTLLTLVLCMLCANLELCSSQNDGFCFHGVQPLECQCSESTPYASCVKVSCFGSNCPSVVGCRINNVAIHCSTASREQSSIWRAVVCVTGYCNYGGICSTSVTQNLAYCSCPMGFVGSLCSQVSCSNGDNPCQNAGLCTQSGGQDVCQCTQGYTGTLCQTAPTGFNGCASDPCYNGGQCIDEVNSFTCHCSTGYTGTRCETDINECNSNPCHNGGMCSDGTNSYLCSCPAGYTGSRCLTDINECNSNPCHNGGICSDGTNSYSCSCPAGYTGSRCLTDINGCNSDPCRNGGTCSDGINRYSCRCQVGYTGSRCQTAAGANNITETTVKATPEIPSTHVMTAPSVINPCDDNPCANEGTCFAGEGQQFICSCTDGFTGSTCDTVIGPCDAIPCANEGTCFAGEGSQFICVCVDGFTGSTCNTQQTNVVAISITSTLCIVFFIFVVVAVGVTIKQCKKKRRSANDDMALSVQSPARMIPSSGSGSDEPAAKTITTGPNTYSAKIYTGPDEYETVRPTPQTYESVE